MIIIALTGALATGKSTVSNLLRSPPHNLPIIDADVLAREVVEPGTSGYKRVVEYFGATTPDLLLGDEKGDVLAEDEGVGGRSESRRRGRQEKGNGKGRPLNRAALGRRVFGASPQRQKDRKVLNSIIHPLVRHRMLQLVLYYHLCGHWAVVLDIPLLYESGLDVFAGVVIMVAVRDPAVQMSRLRARDTGLSTKEAEERVGSQMGVGEKVGRTLARRDNRGKVVWNDGGMGDLEQEVRRVMGEIEVEEGGLLWRFWLWQSPVAVAGVCAWEVWQGWLARRGWERGREEGGKSAEAAKGNDKKER